VMMLCKGDAKLPADLPDSPVQLSATAGEVKCSTAKGGQSRTELVSPPRWTARESKQGDGTVTWKVTPPPSTTAREAQWRLGPAESGTWLTVRTTTK